MDLSNVPNVLMEFFEQLWPLWVIMYGGLICAASLSRYLSPTWERLGVICERCWGVVTPTRKSNIWWAGLRPLMVAVIVYAVLVVLVVSPISYVVIAIADRVDDAIQAYRDLPE